MRLVPAFNALGNTCIPFGEFGRSTGKRLGEVTRTAQRRHGAEEIDIALESPGPENAKDTSSE